MPDREDQPLGVNGAARVLRIFRHLAGVPEGASLGQISDALESPKASVHRALGALRSAGLVSQDSDGRYRYSYDLYRMVFTSYEAVDVVARVRPVLTRLTERFGEATHYAVLDGSEVVYVAKMQSLGAALRITSSIGGRNPAHCTGLGKALLMHRLDGEAQVGQFVADHGPLIRRTDHTLVEPHALATDLASAKLRGYALDREESEIGINCVAVPIFLGTGTQPSGAVSLTALVRHMPANALEQAVPEIRSIIAEELGGTALEDNAS